MAADGIEGSSDAAMAMEHASSPAAVVPGEPAEKTANPQATAATEAAVDRRNIGVFIAGTASLPSITVYPPTRRLPGTASLPGITVHPPTRSANSSGNKRKRVSFGGVSILHDSALKLTSTTAAAAEEAGAGVDRGDASAADADVGQAGAAEEEGVDARTRKRRSMEWLTRSMDDPFSDYLSELQDAEEDYEQPEELYTSDGIPIEPFHLRRERAEGFFDEEGNYVERRLLEESDAWLDSLGAGPLDLEAGLATRLAAAAGGDSSSEPPPLDDDDVAIYKKRIIDMLQPGENVLQALRRLAAGDGQAVQDAHAAATAAAGERQRQRKRQRLEREKQQQQHQGQQQQQGQAQLAGTTDLQPQQQQQQVPTPQSAAAAAANDAQPTLGGSSSSPAAAAAGSSGRKAVQPLSPKTAALSRIPAANRHTFNKLTEYADVLLSNGDTDIYSASRESLIRQLDMADLAVMLGEDLVATLTTSNVHRGTVGHVCAGVQENSSNTAAAAGGGAGEAGEKDEMNTAAAGSSAGEAAAAGAAEDDMDMFAEDEETPAPAAAAAPAATDDALPVQQFTATMTPDAAPAAVKFAAAADPAVSTEAETADLKAAVGKQPKAAAGGAAAGSSASIMEGFELDEASGYYYSSALGYYFEPSSGLFGDASSGLWYKYQEDTGTYQLVESV